MNLIFMRHGEAIDNLNKIISDREVYWSILTESGKNTVLESIKELPEKIDKIYLSPLPRTIHTASLIYKMYPESEPIVDNRIREIYYGKYSGKKNNEELDNIRNKQIKGDYFTRFGDYGENKYEIECRLCDFLTDISSYKDTKETILVISHGSVISYMKRILNIKSSHIELGKIEIITNPDFLSLEKHKEELEKLNKDNKKIEKNEKKKEVNMGKAKVYFTKNITSDSLIKIYEALDVELTGKIGVKVSTGEKGAKGYLKADLIGPLVKKLNGTIIECNTAYPGARTNAEEHLKVAEEHGFTSYADVDIMDAEGDMKIPVKDGKHLKYDIVGTHLDNYDSILNLAHGKGHAMGGFGANLKNQSIGIASSAGKAYIHTAGVTDKPEELFNKLPEQKDFIESMAEAAKAVSDYLEDNNKKIVYITVMNFLSLDCDCDANQHDPVMADLGIVASLDPVANDQAFIDLIWESTDEGASALKERIDKLEGRHILPYAEEIGLGTREYELINID